MSVGGPQTLALNAAGSLDPLGIGFILGESLRNLDSHIAGERPRIRVLEMLTY